SYSIINRWGNLINRGEMTVPIASVFDWSTFNLWDGKTEKGELVTNGTYFYVIEFTLFNDSMTSKSGFLEVFK
ncbi:gliding motility-associated C-terminal domain-containing protein, partial [Fluviicola sp.]|uniref:T9SS type B sorting domain-containing protein n=1 Tax=Fluviicola sp. TaxID=1917219 RepID=UPI00260855F3